jgi:hypothetical protein
MSEHTNEPQLYVVYLGGELAAGRIGEDHEVVMVVATDIQDARKFAKMKWRGSASPHIDAVKLVSVIDGYEVHLEPTEDVDSSSVDATYVP